VLLAAVAGRRRCVSIMVLISTSIDAISGFASSIRMRSAGSRCSWSSRSVNSCSGSGSQVA
jgi:hypothetical protein